MRAVAGAMRSEISESMAGTFVAASATHLICSMGALIAYQTGHVSGVIPLAAALAGIGWAVLAVGAFVHAHTMIDCERLGRPGARG